MRRELWILAVVLLAVAVAAFVARPRPEGVPRLAPEQVRELTLDGLRLGARYEDAARWGRIDSRMENSPEIWRVDDYGPFRTFTMVAQPGEKDLWLTAVLVRGTPMLDGKPVFDGLPSEGEVQARLGPPARKSDVRPGVVAWYYPLDPLRPIRHRGDEYREGQLCVLIEQGRVSQFSFELPWKD